MSDVLDSIRRNFSHRLDLRRRMFAHLGIDLSDDSVPVCQDDLRATLLGCTRCANPDICALWMRQGRAGMPVFCREREHFRRLAVMTGAPDPETHDA